MKCKSAKELMKCDVTSADVAVSHMEVPVDVGVAAKCLIGVAKVGERWPSRSWNADTFKRP